MSSRKELLGQVYRLVPPMLETFHKGQLGRVAVIGGSEDYTGAPYFSAMASARLGADMSHVICEPAAAQVIKTYSPVLMVHPYMRSSRSLTEHDQAQGQDQNQNQDQDQNQAQDQPQPQTQDQDQDSPHPSEQAILDLLTRLHVLVIGPGLGRDPHMQATSARIIRRARARNMPFVLDADGLQLAVARPELVQGCTECILTPNVVEFARLAKSKGLDLDETTGGDEKDASTSSRAKAETQCARLARAFGGVTIIQKGQVDYISNGSETLESCGRGGQKRAGGQGDTLTGCLATLLAYRKAYHEGLWPRGEGEEEMSPARTLALVAYGASAVTRECSRLAFRERGRSMQAADLTDHVHEAFLSLIGEPTEGLEA